MRAGQDLWHQCGDGGRVASPKGVFPEVTELPLHSTRSDIWREARHSIARRYMDLAHVLSWHVFLMPVPCYSLDSTRD